MFSSRKLQPRQCSELCLLLNDLSYTCGAKFSDLQLPKSFECIEVHEHQCTDGIEKLYYTAYPEDILCIHCGTVENIMDFEEEVYPFCSDCSVQGKVYKRGAKK